DPLILNAGERAVLTGDDVQRLAGTGAEDARDAPIGEQRSCRTVSHLRRLHAGDEGADVRPILVAHAAVEVEIGGIGKPIRNLRKPTGLQRRIAKAAGHGVVAVEAQTAPRATLE